MSKHKMSDGINLLLKKRNGGFAQNRHKIGARQRFMRAGQFLEELSQTDPLRLHLQFEVLKVVPCVLI